jgi:hypothetical protein
VRALGIERLQDLVAVDAEASGDVAGSWCGPVPLPQLVSRKHDGGLQLPDPAGIRVVEVRSRWWRSSSPLSEGEEIDAARPMSNRSTALIRPTVATT